VSEIVTNDPNYIDTLFVRGLSGQELEVATMDEKAWFEMNLEKYRSEYRFENVADLQDVDRLLGLELLSYRYTAWLMRGKDYDGLEFHEKDVREHKQKIDTEIRMLKKHMGMDRKGRVESEQESVASYLQNLLRRANEFGVHRNEQVAKAVDIFNDLRTMVGLYHRCDEEERRELGADIEDIWKWINETALPEYDAIDEAFRKEQRLWIKEVG
jgi:hypothetical protein